MEDPQFELSPKFRETDVLGALAHAGQMFSQHPTAERKLIIYSDMRNSTPELNLETETIDPQRSMVPGQLSVPDLHNVTVIVLGTASPYGATASWQKVRNFWSDYLRRAGATLTAYSPVASQ